MFKFYFSFDKVKPLSQGNNTILLKILRPQELHLSRSLGLFYNIWAAIPSSSPGNTSWWCPWFGTAGQATDKAWENTNEETHCCAGLHEAAPTGPDLWRTLNRNVENTWNFIVEWLRTSRNIQWFVQGFLWIMSANISLAKESHVMNLGPRGKQIEPFLDERSFKVTWQRMWTEGRRKNCAIFVIYHKEYEKNAIGRNLKSKHRKVILEALLCQNPKIIFF